MEHLRIAGLAALVALLAAGLLLACSEPDLPDPTSAPAMASTLSPLLTPETVSISDATESTAPTSTVPTVTAPANDVVSQTTSSTPVKPQTSAGTAPSPDTTPTPAPSPAPTMMPTATPAPTPGPTQAPEATATPIPQTGIEPAHETMIKALPWVEDGINASEGHLLETLYYLSEYYPQTLEKLLEEPWIRTERGASPKVDSKIISNLVLLATKGPDIFEAVLKGDFDWMPPHNPGPSRFLERLTIMALNDERTALQIINMQFMKSMEGADYDAFKLLADIAGSDPGGLDYVLSHPDFIDGISDEEAILVPLVYLEWSDPEAAQLIRNLSWVADGVAYWPPADHISSDGNFRRRAETDILSGLIELSRKDREVFIALVSKRWLQAELTGTVHRLFLNLKHLPPQVTLRVLNMPLLLEADEEDIGIVQTLDELAREDSAKVDQLLDRPELLEGITDENRFAVRLLYLEFTNPEASDLLRSVPWVADGIDQSEEAGAEALINTGVEARNLFPELVKRDWAVDGLDRNEVSAIWTLKSMASDRSARSVPSAAVSLLDMPFLESVEPRDAAALQSLSSLMRMGEGDLGYMGQVLAHPSMETGITDADAPLIAFLDSAARGKPEWLNPLLDSGRDWLITRTVELPHTGRVDLAVLEEDEGRLETLDLLERTVRAQEWFMKEPFPPGFAGILATEIDAGGGASGIMTVHPSETGDRALIANLVAFAWWQVPHPTWMGGGVVFLLVWMTVLEPPEAGSPPITFECELARNAAELEQLENELALREFYSESDDRCHYDMGMGLYLHLYSSLNNEVFHEGLSRLYHSTQWFGNLDCDGDKRGLCLVRDAFVDHATPADAAIAAKIIDRWYYGYPLGKDKQ